jgi:hypothetical protein
MRADDAVRATADRSCNGSRSPFEDSVCPATRGAARLQQVTQAERMHLQDLNCHTRACSRPDRMHPFRTSTCTLGDNNSVAGPAGDQGALSFLSELHGVLCLSNP